MFNCTVSSRSSKRPAIARNAAARHGRALMFEGLAPGSLHCGPGVFFAPRWYEMGRKGVDTHHKVV